MDHVSLNHIIRTYAFSTSGVHFQAHGVEVEAQLAFSVILAKHFENWIQKRANKVASID